MAAIGASRHSSSVSRGIDECWHGARNIVSYEHDMYELKLKDLAALAHMSESTVSRFFKLHTTQ